MPIARALLILNARTSLLDSLRVAAGLRTPPLRVSRLDGLTEAGCLRRLACYFNGALGSSESVV